MLIWSSVPLGVDALSHYHTAAPNTHEMKNPVHGMRVFGAARTAGPQASAVNSPIMAPSAIAAIRGRTPNRIPNPAAMCAPPVKYAQPT